MVILGSSVLWLVSFSDFDQVVKGVNVGDGKFSEYFVVDFDVSVFQIVDEMVVGYVLGMGSSIDVLDLQ